MLISDVQTNVVNKIGLAASEKSLVLTWLTQGFRDLNGKLKFYTLSSELIISIGIQDYQLDPTITAIQDVTIINSLVKPLRVTREEILDLRRYANAGTTQGDVYCYCIYGNMFQIYPTPTGEATMLIYYVAEATNSADAYGADFTGSEDMLNSLYMIPLGPLARCLEYYALWQASEYDDKTIGSNSAYYKQMYDSSIVEAKVAVRQRSGRTNPEARVGYPVKRGFPRRRDVYPALSREE